MKKKPAANKIPKGLAVSRKFRTKDRTKRILVVRQGDDVLVQVLAKGCLTIVRTFSVPVDSGVPTPIWLYANAELAEWFAGHLARRGQPPSERQERSRRKRYMKRGMLAFNAHSAIKRVVVELKHPTKPKVKGPLRVVMPYICIYDPRQRIKDTTFRIHKATCQRLDFERRKAIRDGGGDSWVIEARSAEEAASLQLKEFAADDMGWEVEDFEVHNCDGDAR